LSTSVARIQVKVTDAVPCNESLNPGVYLISGAERLPGGARHLAAWNGVSYTLPQSPDYNFDIELRIKRTP